MIEFIATQIPLNKDDQVLFGHKFKVKKGKYIAEIPEAEAEIMAGYGWGFINKSEKTEAPEQAETKKPTKAKQKGK